MNKFVNMTAPVEIPLRDTDEVKVITGNFDFTPQTSFVKFRNCELRFHNNLVSAIT